MCIFPIICRCAYKQGVGTWLDRFLLFRRKVDFVTFFRSLSPIWGMGHKTGECENIWCRDRHRSGHKHKKPAVRLLRISLLKISQKKCNGAQPLFSSLATSCSD